MCAGQTKQAAEDRDTSVAVSFLLDNKWPVLEQSLSQEHLSAVTGTRGKKKESWEFKVVEKKKLNFHSYKLCELYSQDGKQNNCPTPVFWK